MKKILAIDDQKDNLVVIKALLKNYMPDCTVFTSSSGLEGIEIAKKEQPDTILLDIIMPKLDGYEVCKLLKKNPVTKHIPTIMLTAIKTDSESRIKGLELGADAFLAKPIDPLELTAQIKVMFRIKDAEDKLRAEKQILDEKVKEKTKKLKESEEKYKALYNNAPLSYQSLNKEGFFLDVNPTWLRTLGYNSEEVIGKYFGDFLHPDWIPNFESNFPKFKKAGNVHNIHFKIKHKEGHYLDIIYEGCAGYHPDGSFKQTYCVFKDVTKRKQAEEAFHKEKTITEQYINSLPGLFYVFDKSKFIRWNREWNRITGYNDNEISAKYGSDFFEGKDKGIIEERMLKVFLNLPFARLAKKYKCNDFLNIYFIYT